MNKETRIANALSHAIKLGFKPNDYQPFGDVLEDAFSFIRQYDPEDERPSERAKVWPVGKNTYGYSYVDSYGFHHVGDFNEHDINDPTGEKTDLLMLIDGGGRSLWIYCMTSELAQLV